VETDLKQVPPAANPDLPDRWDQSLDAYRSVIASIRNRRRLGDHLENLRTVYERAMTVDAEKNKLEIPDGPAQTVTAAKACSAAFAQVQAAKIDLAVEVEFDKNRHQLDQLPPRCTAIRVKAEQLVAQQKKAAELARKKERMAKKTKPKRN
jgi:hypothetical protein